MIDEKKLIECLAHDMSCFETKEKKVSQLYVRVDDMVRMINGQPKIGGWIPCSDQLPDKWEDVMICYYNDREEKHLSDIACLDDDGNWKLWRESGGYFPYNFKKKITHWRPLPDLPEECHG